ncbi:Receptor-like protein 56, partial [Linum grandiflorum]
GLGKLTHLEVLDLSFNRFNSTLLTSLGSLSSLKVLRLRGNSMDGINELAGLCNLKQLQVLDLWNNHFTGELPQCLSNLTSLQELRLTYNSFLIPFSLTPFFNLSNLKLLYADHNQLIYNDEHDLHFPTFQLQTLYLSAPDGHGGSKLPSFLNHQSDLQALHITNVHIEDDGFPTWLLDNNTNLRELNLVNDSLSGSVQLNPHWNLTQLDISDNYLEGHIPLNISSCLPSLSSLVMSNNAFNGSLPDFVSSKLVDLDLSNNKLSGALPQTNELSGTIPLWLSNMSSLGVLDLSSNNFVGELPVGFPSPRMTQVYLSKNGFVGPITIDDSALYQLLILDISHNNLTGSVPRQIDKMSRLRYILLNDNNFFGEIPFGMCTLQHLRLIDFSNNFFSGQIPPCIITTKAFPYSYQGRNLLLMSGINLANNNFSGEIPEEFGDLTTIRLMNLSHNELTGPIPSAFSSLDQMESLDISYNNLTGSIPPQLVDLHSLAVFSVAYNNLSGKTPERIAQFATFDQDCYDGNPFLCGWPLPTKCSTPREMPSPALMPFAEEDSDGEAGIIDMEVFAASFTVSFGMVLLAIAAVLYINENWRRVWFYYVEVVMTGCYYFMVDHLPVPAKFRVLDSSSSGVLSW